ncbi:glycosyltransferase family 4 protein [Proteinivorax hydrogeniformans]|uniref:Glycosyltransferase family 4 protein n=1 Tax=Proteinivorax hydrogeniformans TaxID=1826727 RepID=A0AAU8HX02_9FIRM
MKVLHIANTDFFIKKLMLNKLRGVADKGYEVHAMAPFTSYRQDIEQAGIKTHDFKFHREIRPISDVAAAIRLAKYLKKHNFTIVHTHTSKPGVIGRIAARIAKVPIVVHTSHGLPFYQGQNKIKFHIYKCLEKTAGYFTDIIFSQNKEDLNQIAKYKLVAPHKAVFEGNGVNIKQLEDKLSKQNPCFIKRKYSVENQTILGFYARLEPVKGHLFFLEAFRNFTDQFPNNDVILLLAGGNFGYCTDYEKEVDQKIKELGLDNHIKKVGYIEEITELLSITDILVLPSQKEGLPRIVMESMTASIPAIGTDVLGTREIIKDKHNGRLVPYKDVEAMTEALSELINNPAKRKEYGQNAREVILKEFDERLVVERIHQQYTKLIDNQKNN